jgi:hypothetical protein
MHHLQSGLIYTKSNPITHCLTNWVFSFFIYLPFPEPMVYAIKAENALPKSCNGTFISLIVTNFNNHVLYEEIPMPL